ESCDGKTGLLDTTHYSCDASCRTVISAYAGAAEAEPNDDVLGANVLDVSSGSFTVNGRLGGGCDFDTYSITPSKGGTFQASLTGGGPAPPVRMVLLDVDGHTALASTTSAAGALPSLSGQHLSGGATYYLRLNAVPPDNSKTTWSYGLA